MLFLLLNTLSPLSEQPTILILLDVRTRLLEISGRPLNMPLKLWRKTRATRNFKSALSGLKYKNRTVLASNEPQEDRITPRRIHLHFVSGPAPWRCGPGCLRGGFRQKPLAADFSAAQLHVGARVAHELASGVDAVAGASGHLEVAAVAANGWTMCRFAAWPD